MSTWDGVVNVSLGALLASIVALTGTVSYSHPPNIEKTTEVVTSVVLKILMTAGVLGWTTTSFSKRNRVGIFVFSTVGALSIFAFSGYLLIAVVGSNQRKSADRVFGANAAEGIDKLTAQMEHPGTGDGTFIAKTGDPENDELSTALNYFAGEITGVVVGMDSEVDALHQTGIYEDAVISNTTNLESEAQKRLQALQIIERYKEKMSALPSKVEAHIVAMGLSESNTHGAIEGIKTTMAGEMPEMKQMFDLLKNKQQAELNYLRFMSEWSGDYQLRDNKMTFTTAGNAAQFTALEKGIDDATNALATFRDDHLKKTQEGKAKLSEMGK